MKGIGKYEVARFLEVAGKQISLTNFTQVPYRPNMQRIAEEGSFYTKYFKEDYLGTYEIDDLTSWLNLMKETYPTCKASILEWGDSFGVEWYERVDYTNAERAAAKQWLLDNPEEPAKPIKWRKAIPMGDALN